MMIRLGFWMKEGYRQWEVPFGKVEELSAALDALGERKDGEAPTLKPSDLTQKWVDEDWKEIAR